MARYLACRARKRPKRQPHGICTLLKYILHTASTNVLFKKCHLAAVKKKKKPPNNVYEHCIKKNAVDM